MVINLLKSIIPVSVFVIGFSIDVVGKFLSGIAAILYNVSATIHVQLETNTGKKLKQIEKSVADVMKLYTTAVNKVASGNKEENRISNLVKSNPNIVQLGKKKNDESQD